MFSANTAQVSSDKLYVDDVFSTYLYTGNSSTQTITNGIDLAGKGGLVWLKSRGPSGYNHYLYDTNRGATNVLFSNLTNASGTQANGLTAFNNNGFTQGSFLGSNGSGENYVSWTFRKAPKFFDVVTWTGTGSARVIPHNLGSTPGCIIVKRTDTADIWPVWQNSLTNAFSTNTHILVLNETGASVSVSDWFNGTQITSTGFGIKTNSGINASGGTYVAYLFAHNAGGFGLTGTDNVISCGSFTTDGSGAATINLGYEPQWVLFKETDASTQWELYDSMRGFAYYGNKVLSPNSSAAESSFTTSYHIPTATGFQIVAGQYNPSTTHIYIAIRRGPMKTPTSGTSVFSPQIYTGDGTSNRALTGFGFSPDLVIQQLRPGNTYDSAVADRLRGVNNTGSTIATPMLRTNTTEAEGYSGATQCDIQLLNMDGITVGPNSFTWSNGSGYSNVLWNFKRAPGFMDVVAYKGTTNITTGLTYAYLNHSLNVVPELAIFKQRSDSSAWPVYHKDLGTHAYLGDDYSNVLYLNQDGYAVDNFYFASPSEQTASQFVFHYNPTGETALNEIGRTYVAYLFASCPGVSKVGSYTGNGSSQTINCGFSTGARFILIKRTDSTGDWFTWDSARGIIAANDPHLSLNTTAGEVTTDDSVDPDNSGFIVNQVAATNINVTSATYIYLAIA